MTRKEQEENEKEKKKEEEEALRSSKVKAAEFTTIKISGLEISQRESYLSLLETVIRKNYDKTSHGWNILLIFLELDFSLVFLQERSKFQSQMKTEKWSITTILR